MLWGCWFLCFPFLQRSPEASRYFLTPQIGVEKHSLHTMPKELRIWGKKPVFLLVPLVVTKLYSLVISCLNYWIIFDLPSFGLESHKRYTLKGICWCQGVWGVGVILGVIRELGKGKWITWGEVVINPKTGS